MIPKPNKFSSYELTEREESIATHVSPETIAYLYNLREPIASELILMEIDKDGINAYLARRNNLKGQLAILSLLIDQMESH